MDDIEGVVFDSTLPSEKGAEIKIKQIIKSNNIPTVCFLLPRSLSRCLRAFHKRDRKIPESEFFKTHSGARKAVLYIANNHPEVEILIYYNHLPEEIGAENKLGVESESFKFEEIIFDNKKDMITFLEREQCSEDEIKNLTSHNR